MTCWQLRLSILKARLIAMQTYYARVPARKGIAKALFAYAIIISKEAGFDGVLVFKAKTTELVDYYIHEFGACHAGSYDPFRLIIWEDAAETILSEYRKEDI